MAFTNILSQIGHIGPRSNIISVKTIRNRDILGKQPLGISPFCPRFKEISKY